MVYLIGNEAAWQIVASPQTSVGVRLSRIYFSDNRTPTDVCGEAREIDHRSNSLPRAADWLLLTSELKNGVHGYPKMK